MGRWAALAVVVAVTIGAKAHFTAGPSRVASAADTAEARAAAQMLASAPEPEPRARGRLPVGVRPDKLPAAAPLDAPRRVAAEDGLVLSSAPFRSRAAKSGVFVRSDGTELGFERLPLPPFYETMQPSENEFAPLAAGDVNADGWPDVAVGTSDGVYLYMNAGGRFVLQELDTADRVGSRTTYVALIDLDGDAAPDLFSCAWMRGCTVLWNEGGGFSDEGRTDLPRDDELAVHSAAFADVDRDGTLDVATGSAVALGWQFAPYGRIHVWRGNGDRTFREETLPGPRGETLTLLFTDPDGDGWPDLYAGNDFDEPDVFFDNVEGRLSPTSGDDIPFPISTESTMSVDTGDIDNDGRLEVYEGAIAYGGIGMDAVDRPRWAPHDACRAGFSTRREVLRCLQLADFETAVARSRDVTDVTECHHYPDALRLRQCVVAGYLWNEAFVELPNRGAAREAVREECSKIPEDFETIQDVCDVVPKAPLDYAKGAKLHAGQMPQLKNWNVLLRHQEGGYENVAEDWGVSFGGWTWNARFADIDNDTWQDLFITQGTRLRFSNTSNLLYKNEQGKGFSDRATELGLEYHVPTGGSLFLDFDQDGRRDIIGYPFALTPTVWRNEVADPRAMQLALRDDTSPNREAIGARIEIRSDDGRIQVGEIKASGGFESDDWKVAWFGLGDWHSVTSISVTWPDGSSQTLRGLSLGPGRYSLRRTATRAR